VLQDVHTCSQKKLGERLIKYIMLSHRPLEGILCTNANKFCTAFLDIIQRLGSEVFTAVALKCSMFLDSTPCSTVKAYVSEELIAAIFRVED
jgi:hypothetical protein